VVGKPGIGPLPHCLLLLSVKTAPPFFERVSEVLAGLAAVGIVVDPDPERIVVPAIGMV
jgi:hypothetical protein